MLRYISVCGDMKKWVCGIPKTTGMNKTMMKNSIKPSVTGTRSGYVIRFTCPECHHENAIIINMPKSYYKESRDGTCGKCRKHFNVLTPGQH